jgi:tetratricopeptide (TPR) repeat protein
MNTPQSQTQNELIARVEALLADADATESAMEREHALASARALAEKCVAANPDQPDCLFIAGLAMYNSFTVDENYGPEAEAYLTSALKLDGNHQFANLYLAHYYYDIGRYEEALAHFKKLKNKFLSSANQKWRLLKVHELVLCCKAHLNNEELDTNSFLSLLRDYDSAAPEDVPVPLELASTLVRTKGSSLWRRVDRNRVITKFLDLLDRKGFSDAMRQYISEL